jgi:hypothetical protein
MTLTDTVILSGIVAAFALFAALLAWGEYQTRDLNRNLPRKGGGVDEPRLAQSRPLHKAMKLQRIAENTKRIAEKTGRRRETSHR